MSRRSEEYGVALAENFAQKSKTARLDEVDLFRALREAMLATTPHFLVEEYHGAVSRVLFPACPPWTNEPARCELSDLCIIWFRKRPRPEARITFLQAKLSKSAHSPCIADGSINESFIGDSTQWYLLNKRPEIVGCFHTFRPPTNLLKDALLPSVATYGVFHKVPGRGYSFFYASADIIAAATPSKPGDVRLSVPSIAPQAQIGGLTEQKSACCPVIFGEALFSGRIGTPFDYNSVASSNDGAWRDAIRRWLGSTLGNAIRDNQVGPVIRSFIGTLDIQFGESDGEVGSPAKSIMFIQGDDEEVGE